MTTHSHITRTDFYQNFMLLMAIAIGLLGYCLLSQASAYFTAHHFQWSLGSQLWYLFSKVWLPAVVISPLVGMCALRFPFLPNEWRRATGFHVSIFLALSFTHSVLLSYEYYYFADMDPEMRSFKAWQHMGHFMFGDGVILFDVIIYTLLVAYTNLRRFYFVAQAKDVEASQLSHQLTQTRLQALRMQVNPHFLFNTLNAIAVLIMKQENKKAVDMINRLSHLFRQSLDETQVMTTLERELNTVTQYLDIEKVRFGERLEYHIHYLPEISQAVLPSMLLQPLLENSVRHGFGQKESRGDLIINCHLEGEVLHIVIEDNGIGFDATQKAPGIGIENVRQRLRSHYGDNYEFNILSAFGQGTRILIRLPFNLEGDS